MANSLPITSGVLMSASVHVPNSPPRFAMLMRIHAGSIDRPALANLAIRASATAQRGNWSIGIYGGEGSMANSNYTLMRDSLISSGFPGERIIQLSNSPSGQKGDTTPSFNWR